MNTFFRYMKTALTVFPIFVVVMLSGCGGGGGGGGVASAPSTIISGTAAAGAPVVGYVSVRDSSTNTQPVKTNIPIQANGSYSVDVAGLKAPFAFQAIGTVGGKTVSLYSAATSADVGGTIDITPFTDLIIRNVAATAVDTYINSGAFSALTAAQLDAKRVALTTLLTPALTAMGVSGSIDLLRATFNANGTGLDRFMDAVQVSTTPTTATITNILDAANTLMINTAAGGTPTGTLGIANLAPSATPLDGIMAAMNTFSSFFATALPSPANANLLALFTPTFLDDGKGASAFLTDITTQPKVLGLKFNNVVIDSINPASGVAQVHFAPVAGSGINLSRDQVGGTIGWQMKQDPTTKAWLLDGNQRIAHVRVRASASQNVCSSVQTCGTVGITYQTGLMLEFDNRGQQAIGSVVITGNGLPPVGVTLLPVTGQTSFGINTANPNYPCIGCTGNNNWQMIDTDIAKVTANSTYSIAVYSNANPATLLATYTEVVPVAPVLNTGVAGLAYPALSGLVNFAGKGAVTLTPAWTMPAGLWGNQINVYAYQGTNGGVPSATANVLADLSFQNASSGTATLALPAPASGVWTGGSYWIGGFDQYGGVVSTNYQ